MTFLKGVRFLYCQLIRGPKINKFHRFPRGLNVNTYLEYIRVRIWKKGEKRLSCKAVAALRGAIESCSSVKTGRQPGSYRSASHN